MSGTAYLPCTTETLLMDRIKNENAEDGSSV